MKKRVTILGWRAGYPRRGQMSRCSAADFSLTLHLSTALQTDFVSILHCLVGANAIFRFDTALRSGAEDTGISGRGYPSKLIDEKKVRGWEILHLLNFPCPRRWSCKSENLQFYLFWKILFSWKFVRLPSRFYLRKADLFSFWKTPLKSLSSISSCFPFKVYFLTWYNHYTDFPFYCKYYFKLI